MVFMFADHKAYVAVVFGRRSSRVSKSAFGSCSTLQVAAPRDLGPGTRQFLTIGCAFLAVVGEPLHAAPYPFLIDGRRIEDGLCTGKLADELGSGLCFRLGALQPVSICFLECVAEFFLNRGQRLHVRFEYPGEIGSRLISSHDVSSTTRVSF